MDHNHFSNHSFSCPKEAPYEIWSTLAQRLQRRSHLKLSTFFHTNVWGPYKCIRKQTWPRSKKVNFSNFGRPSILDDLCKDSASRHPLFWRRRILKVFTIYWHGGHLGQWTTTILVIFHSPAPRRFHMKFEQHWSSGFRGEVVWNSQHFSHTNVWCQYKCTGKQIWPCRRKVKCQCTCTTIILATLVDLPSPMICAKIQP